MPFDSPDGDDDFVDRWIDSDGDTREAEQPFGDPEESTRIPEAPSVTRYEIAEPNANTLGQDLSDVDPELLNTFVISVVLTNIGVLLLSVGLLLVVFRGMIELGGSLSVIGILALIRVRQHYRSYKRDRDDAKAATRPEADPEPKPEPVDDTGHNR